MIKVREESERGVGGIGFLWEIKNGKPASDTEGPPRLQFVPPYAHTVARTPLKASIYGPKGEGRDGLDGDGAGKARQGGKE